MKHIVQIACLVITAWLLLACEGDITGDSNLTAAKEYLDKGDNNAANIELKNALQKNSSNAEARFLLGKLYFKARLYADALKELQKARDLGISDEMVLPLLAQSLLARNDLEVLQELSLESVTNQEARAEILAAQGTGRLRQGDIDGASDLIEQALSASTSSQYVLLAAARLTGARSKGNFDETRQQLKQLLAKDSKYAPAWSLLGDVELRSLRTEKAEEAFSQSLTLSSDDINDRYKRALLRLQIQDIEGARKDLVWLKKLAPDNIGTHYLNGIIQAHDGNFKEAITSLDIAQRDEDRYPLALLYLANAHNTEGNFAQAENFAYRFLSIAPSNVPGRKLLATIKVRSGNLSEAEELIRPILEENNDDIAAIKLLAGILLKKNESEEAVELLLRAAELQPNSPELQLTIGQSLLSSGKIEGGLEYIETALKMNPQLQKADMLLIAAHMRQGNYEAALQAAKSFQERNPGDVAPQNMLGQVLLARGERDEAESAFLKSLELSASDLTAHQSLALIALHTSKLDLANDYYKKALNHHKDNLQVLIKLAALEELRGNLEEMKQYLEHAIDVHHNAVTPRVILARLFLTKGEPEKVPALFTQFGQKERQIPDVMNVLGLSELAQGKYQSAREMFQKIIELKADAPEPYYNLALAEKGLDNPDRMKGELEKAIEISPSYLSPRIEVTRYYFREKQRDEAVKNLDMLKKLAPENPEVIKLIGTLASFDGDQEKALAIWQELFEKHPTYQNMKLLAQQKWSLGDRQGGQKVQKSWVDKYPMDTVARFGLADMYLGQGEEAKAADQYTKILGIQKDDPLALNNLAWLLRDKKPKQALEYAQQAVEQSQQSPLAMDTLAVVLLKNNETVKAQRTIERALEKLPNNPSIKYHSAMINAAAGDKGKAKKYLTELLSGKDEFPERQEAEDLLKTL